MVIYLLPPGNENLFRFFIPGVFCLRQICAVRISLRYSRLKLKAFLELEFLRPCQHTLNC